MLTWTRRVWLGLKRPRGVRRNDQKGKRMILLVKEGSLRNEEDHHLNVRRARDGEQVVSVLNEVSFWYVAVDSRKMFVAT